MPLIFFDPPENIRKPLVFWCFQGVSKELSGMKWVKKSLIETLLEHFMPTTFQNGIPDMS